VRLLDDPAMMQAFVHCLATERLRKKTGKRWATSLGLVRQHKAKREVSLVDTPKADVIQAGVVFVLQQREGPERVVCTRSRSTARRRARSMRRNRNREPRPRSWINFAKICIDGVDEHLASDEINDNSIDRSESKRNG